MTQQIQHQQQQIQPMSGQPLDVRLSQLEVRVGTLADGIDRIMHKLDSRDRMPWGVIGTFGGLVLTVIVSVGGLAFRPLSDDITDLKAYVLKMEMRSERYVPREDLDKRFEVITQRRDDLQRLTDARISQTERDVDTIQKAVVPRGEHEQMWAAQRARDSDLQRQTDQNRQGLYDLNTPRDTLQAIQRRLDEVERAGRRPPDR